MKTEKAKIRLNEKELRKAAIDHGLKTNAQIAEAIGVSPSQLWRSTLPTEHHSYNEPGPSFIAGVLKKFGEPFERFFFLDSSDTNATKLGGV
jgi:transcriptional regulator with XRE-family HTH domain